MSVIFDQQYIYRTTDSNTSVAPKTIYLGPGVVAGDPSLDPQCIRSALSRSLRLALVDRSVFKALFVLNLAMISTLLNPCLRLLKFMMQERTCSKV